MVEYRTHPSRNRNSSVPTSAWVSEALRRILESKYQFNSIADPCVGSGGMVAPWIGSKTILYGADLDCPDPWFLHKFRKGDFLSFKQWNIDPDIILCNPPFNGGKDRRMMLPEQFLRQIVRLFGRHIPIVFIVPVGFRHNVRKKSKRRKWLQGDSSPRISSIFDLPLDAFEGVEVFSEILCFNLPLLPPHLVL